MVGGGDVVVHLLLQLRRSAIHLLSVSEAQGGVRLRSGAAWVDWLGLHVGLCLRRAVRGLYMRSFPAQGPHPGWLCVLEFDYRHDWLVQQALAVRNRPGAGRV